MNYPLRQAQHRCMVAETRRRDFAEAMVLFNKLVAASLIIGIALVASAI